MFATGEKRCPVASLKKYLEKRPTELKTTGPLYLGVIENPKTSEWYKKTSMGKNTINNIKKLKSTGIPKCEIKNITGHSSEQGLDDYDSGDENEQRMMSNIIDNFTHATTTRQVLQPLSSVQTQPGSAPSQNLSQIKVYCSHKYILSLFAVRGNDLLLIAI